MIDQVRQALSRITLPGTDIPVNRCARVESSSRSKSGVLVILDLGLPIKHCHDEYSDFVRSALAENGLDVEVEATQQIPTIQPANNKGHIQGVKNIIAVASGKGGVGKSTTAVNIALALSAGGANVGILDADIYGPSQPHMLGVADERPEVLNNNTILPINARGLQLVSMGNLVNENTPMVWRGPMASGALQQLLTQTQWQGLDYLVVDMPPGTGDIQLTLSQSVPVSGSLIVTTPQDIALIDAKKGIEMFRKVNIPVYGVVENMSTHTCTQCGHKEAIFGEAGGERLALEFNTKLLGRLPLAHSIRELTDSGNPSVAQDISSEISKSYLDIAHKLAIEVWAQSLSELTVPIISVEDD